MNKKNKALSVWYVLRNTYSNQFVLTKTKVKCNSLVLLHTLQSHVLLYLGISNIRLILQFFRCKLMFFNQTLNGRIELGSYSVGKIRFFGEALDFAIEPAEISSSHGNLFESMRGHPSVPRYQGEFLNFNLRGGPPLFR